MPAVMTTVTIERLAAGGDGVGYVDGQVCFVPFSAPGDVLDVEIIKKNKKFCRGRIREIVSPSMHRTPPPCPHFSVCGGCAWQHMTPSMQRDGKAAILSYALNRRHIEMVASRASYGYRSVARLHIGQSAGQTAEIGFVRIDGRHIVPIKACPVLAPELSEVLPRIRQLMVTAGLIKGEVRLALGDAGVIACVLSPGSLPERFYVAARKAAPSSLSGVVALSDGIETTVAGSAGVEILGADDQRFTAPASSFGQANRDINRQIAETIRTWLMPLRFARALELFAGAGNHTITIAPFADRLLASEIDGAACAAMTANTGLRGMDHVAVSQEDALAAYHRHGRDAELVVLNPPRTGHLPLAQALSDGDHRMILYISCNPATLSRDLAELLSKGYNLTAAKGFDMFPQTAHMESVVLLERC